MSRNVEALSWMDQALKYEGRSLVLLQGAGATAMLAGIATSPTM
jgi:hypothetical protein